MIFALFRFRPGVRQAISSIRCRMETSRTDLDLAAKRYRDLLKELG